MNKSWGFRRSLFVLAILLATMSLLFSSSTPPTVFSQDSSQPTFIESDDPLVQQTGTWTHQPTSNASGGGYLYSSGSPDDALTLEFVGSSVEIVYITNSAFGDFAIEIDNTIRRTVVTASEETTFDNRAVVDYLEPGTHTLRVYAVEGVVAIDGFVITPLSTPTEGLSSHYGNLMSKATAEGKINIIVAFDVNYQPEGDLNGIAVQQQRNEIRDARTALVTEMQPYSITTSQVEWNIPYVAMTVDAAGLQHLINSPNVIGIEEDILVRIDLDVSTALIGADDVWGAGYTGSGQAVAILDSGVDSTHSFLSGRVVEEYCFSYQDPLSNAYTLCPNGTETQSGAGAASPYSDGCVTDTGNLCNHGTHVAGIAAGDGSSFDGVAPGADILAFQVFSQIDDIVFCQGQPPCIGSYSSDQISALQTVYNLRNTHNIASANLSLGSGSYEDDCDSHAGTVLGEDLTTSYKAIIDLLRSVDIATVISSGNSGFTNSVGFPGCISTAITVGASDNSDVIASFSNTSSVVDLLAPGVGVNSSIVNNGFASWNGTSMAAPHVTGAWALLKSAFPNATVDQLEAAFESTGVEITDDRDANNIYVKPRIQVDAAFNTILECVTVTFATDGNGSVTPNPTHSSACPENQFIPGTEVSLTATPDSGWVFSHWIGATGGATTTYTVDEAATVTGVFIVNITKPVLNSPLGTITDGSLMPLTYDWNETTNTTWYRVYIVGPSGIIHDKWYEVGNSIMACNDTNCTVTPDLSYVNGAYVWYIHAYGPDGYKEWSDRGDFTVNIEKPGPVNKTLPSNSATLTSGDVVFTWDHEPNATWYQFWQGTSTWYKAADICVAEVCSTNRSLLNGTYNWYVQAYGPGGSSAWGAGFTFTVDVDPPVVPVKLTPANNSTLPSTEVEFTWEQDPNVTWYEFWQGTSTWYKATDICVANVCSTSRSLNNGIFSWNVRGYGSGGLGNWGANFAFTIAVPEVGPITQLKPPGVPENNPPTFEWEADPYAEWYQLYVTGGPSNAVIHNQWYNKTAVACPSGTGTCSVTIPQVLPKGDYEWWLLGWNISGNGPWNGPKPFEVTLGIPSPPSLVSPIAGATVDTRFPTFTWNAVHDALSYRLYLSGPNGLLLDTWFTSTEVGCASGTGTCSYTPTNPLLSTSGTHAWWMQASNTYGAGSWNGYNFNFALQAPGTVALVSPDGTTDTGTPIYEWAADPNTAWYQLVLNDPSATAYTEWVSVAQAGCSSGVGTCQWHPYLNYRLPGVEYSWQILAWNAVGSTWSGPQTFIPTVEAGFTEYFSGSATNWLATSGTWSVDSNYWYTNPPLDNSRSSSYFDQTYDHFVFHTTMRRSADISSSNGVIIRGTPNPLQPDNNWNSGYYFQYAAAGYFSVFRIDPTSVSVLQDWTYSPAINTGNAWNDISIFVINDKLQFRINNVLVWQGADSTYMSGYTGVTMYRATEGQLYVDQAQLYRNTYPLEWAYDDATISPAQLALNAEANRNVTGDITGIAPINQVD